MSSGVFGRGLALVWCLQGAVDWSRVPLPRIAARVRCERVAGSRTGREPGRRSRRRRRPWGGARELDDGRCGEGPRGWGWVMWLWRPMAGPSGGAEPPGCIHPFVCPRRGGRGAWGGFASGPGGANHRGARAAGPDRQGRCPAVAGGGKVGGLAPGHRAAGVITRRPGRGAAWRRVRPGSGCARRAGRRRPG